MSVSLSSFSIEVCCLCVTLLCSSVVCKWWLVLKLQLHMTVIYTTLNLSQICHVIC